MLDVCRGVSRAANRGFNKLPPAASADNAAVLREVKAALVTNPEALKQLSALLSPSTTRNLSRALTSMRKSQQTTEFAAPVTLPTTQELKLVALRTGLPFIGFGFVDNFIMIVAGDYIDLTLGVSLGISSMAAAGIGNTIADIAGLGFGNVIENCCVRLGLPNSSLTSKQMLLKSTRIAKVSGSIIGVTVGCLLGLAPLMFLQTRPKETSKSVID
ncbi:uncharacterized protein CCR75_003093 [Bremia lactucae]|uniref:Transmembrane protein 65 n=1 Tax=Bremia lactucae TaxID=4779 RepID=A0A976IKH3_BRELC|nr:hypothetical protein CCR75_003089 [Bremia lactucae]TDH73572.1 hypothetical protein CCR75_003093 [Bremia lactucae]